MFLTFINSITKKPVDARSWVSDFLASEEIPLKDIGALTSYSILSMRKSGVFVFKGKLTSGILIIVFGWYASAIAPSAKVSDG